MDVISYAQIDEHFRPWAQGHSLPVYTEVGDEETRSVLIVDAAQNEFQIWSVPDYKADCTLVRVGAALLNRGGKRHTFYRERRNFVFDVSVPLAQVPCALEQAWSVVSGWQNVFQNHVNA